MARAALKPVEEPGTEPDTVPVTAERTPARAKLAEAIEQRDTLARYITEESAAVSAAETAKRETSSTFYQAEQELARSMPNFRPDHPPQGATSEELDEFYAWVNSPPTPIAEARAVLASAKDEYDSAKALLAFHTRQLTELQRRQSWGSSKVDDAVKAVVASDPSIGALMELARRIAFEYRDISYLVSKIADRGALPAEHKDWDSPPRHRDGSTMPLTAKWTEAMERLKTDSDAPLPA